MAKSHDDPDEIDDPIERRRQQREAAEKAARVSHPGWEASEPPPPITTPWPTRAGVGSPSATIHDPPHHVKRLGNWGKYIAGMVAGGTALYAVGRPVFDWFATRPSETDLTNMRAYCVGVAASAAASAVAPQGAPAHAQRLTDLDKKITHESKRWDALDKWHRQQFQRRNAPPICQFGPKAESRGNACTVEDVDSP